MPDNTKGSANPDQNNKNVLPTELTDTSLSPLGTSNNSISTLESSALSGDEGEDFSETL
jgi:hypothetical protein